MEKFPYYYYDPSYRVNLFIKVSSLVALMSQRGQIYLLGSPSLLADGRRSQQAAFGQKRPFTSGCF